MWGKEVMSGQFENIKNDIRKIRNDESKYIECVNKCNNFLKLLNETKNENTKDSKWFVHHNLGLLNKKLGNIDIAIKHELKAINYTNHKKGDCDYRYIYSIWLIAECYSLQGNKEEASKLYSECSKLYKMLGEEQQRICTIWNKAKLLENFKSMEKLIKIYENKTLKTTIITHGDLQYDEVLSEMYCDLFNLYILEDSPKAMRLLYIISDKSLRKELGKKFKVA